MTVEPQSVPRLPVGSTLRGYRTEGRISQAEVARRVGLSQGAISNYELDKRDVPFGAFVLWCGALGLKPEKVVKEVTK